MDHAVWNVSCYIKQLLYDAKILYIRTGLFFLLEQGFLSFGQESMFIQHFNGDFIATQWLASAANTSFRKQSQATDNNTFINLTGNYTPPERVLNQSKHPPCLGSHQIRSCRIKGRKSALQNKSWRRSQRFAFFRENLSQFDFHALLK